ncbi:hypothetical protein D2T31_08215 [Sinirhodobacter populi]|uniref:Uncharacterized protein n=1 Tax=Paenirhodobacter populi TaxID=2306993 RepID=A0A443KCJ9_9RHOB|nr:hypothetical protein [Sinirhodobacter populi]RWR30392.1 hypothetical protein D2T31_08215 [Sinirhodobacter populi]
MIRSQRLNVAGLMARRMTRSSGILTVQLADAWALRHLSVCIKAGAELSGPPQSLFRHLCAA